MLSREVCNQCRKEQRRKYPPLLEYKNWMCPHRILGHSSVGCHDRVNNKCPKMFEQLVWLATQYDLTVYDKSAGKKDA